MSLLRSLSYINSCVVNVGVACEFTKLVWGLHDTIYSHWQTNLIPRLFIVRTFSCNSEMQPFTGSVRLNVLGCSVFIMHKVLKRIYKCDAPCQNAIVMYFARITLTNNKAPKHTHTIAHFVSVSTMILMPLSMHVHMQIIWLGLSFVYDFSIVLWWLLLPNDMLMLCSRAMYTFSMMMLWLIVLPSLIVLPHDALGCHMATFNEKAYGEL